jgi:hypothetical protein
MDSDFINFSYHVTGEKELILDLRSSKDYTVDRYKITLLYSLIDFMAKCVYPNKSNKDRMLEFIVKYCDWGERDRVSIPQLNEYLKINTSPSLDQVRAFVSLSISSFSESQPTAITIDPLYDELLPLWPDEEKVKKLKVFRHLNLFYEQRNGLIHELHSRGAGFSLFSSEEPHYMHLTAVVGYPSNPILTKSTFELYYPIQFYIKLIDTALQNLEVYFNRNPKLSPFSSYSFGSLWI